MRPCPRQIGPLLALLSTAGLAADPPTAAPPGPLEEVQVVARRNLLGQAFTGAGSAERISAEEQVSLNRTVADWIERLPGVSLNGQGGLLQSYSLRGFSRWRVRTELDGVPIITDRRAGNSAEFVPPELLGTTTVQLGPASALYGSGALGGVVSLSTLRPDGLRMQASGQTVDRQRSLAFAAGDPERYGAALAWRRADNAEDADGNELNSGFEQLAALLRYSGEVAGREFSLSWLPSRSEDIGKSSILYPDGQVADYPEALHSVARAELRDGDRWLLQLYHHYQDWQSDVRRVGSRRNVTDYRADTVGALFYRRQSLLEGSGRWGVEWIGRRNVRIDEREFDPDGELVYAGPVLDGREDNVAAFLDQRWQLGDYDFGGGLRYDYVEQSQGGADRSDTRLDFSLHAGWSGIERLSLALELGTGFRFPTLTELYFDGTTPRGDTRGNPDLDPERNRALELAARYRGDRLTLRANAYYNWMQDYIERYQISPDLRGYRNLDRAEIYGFELDFEYRAGERWYHDLSYQWQRGEDRDGQWLDDLNPPTLRYLLRWEGRAFSFRSDLSYRWSRDDCGPSELPLADATVWNASVSRSLGSGWLLELYGNNLLDQQYLGSADAEAPYQPGLILGLRVEWNRP